MFINKFCILNYVEKWLKEFIEIFTSMCSALENWIYSFAAFARELNTAGISGPQISILPFWQRKIANTYRIYLSNVYAVLRLLLSFCQIEEIYDLVRSRLSYLLIHIPSLLNEESLGLDSLSEKRLYLLLKMWIS